MSDLYVHIFPNPSPEQQANLAALGRYLILNEKPIAASGRFDFDSRPMLAETSGPGDAYVPRIARPPVGFGPAAGVPSLPDEGWEAYMLRAFCMQKGYELDLWVQGIYWGVTDPSIRGAALRIAYALDYGVPHDWHAILFGLKKSDYMTTGFIWERLDLVPGVDVDP